MINNERTILSNAYDQAQLTAGSRTRILVKCFFTQQAPALFGSSQFCFKRVKNLNGTDLVVTLLFWVGYFLED
jgi:hypothetical protein